jgi:hypothetical protein
MKDRWLEDGRFDHARHEQSVCAECHKFRAADGTLKNVMDSTRASDVLLGPGIEGCKTCHATAAAAPTGFSHVLSDHASDRSIGPSRCTTCHLYHRPPTRRRTH